MLCKLILRNVHRSARDYGIYLVTLILSVGMFYGFLSLSSSHYQAALPRSIHLELLERGMQVTIPVLGLLLLFLLSYVNAHLLRAKQKSFAVQTILGMERRTVALLFFGETLLLGSLAILAGIALGAFLSQLASFAVFRAFGESYRLQPGLFQIPLPRLSCSLAGSFWWWACATWFWCGGFPCCPCCRLTGRQSPSPSAPRCGDGFPLFSWSPPPPED